MKGYKDLEASILACFIQNPELMKTTRLKDEHFINNQRLWIFMKTFYKRFGNFDFTLMASVSQNKYKIVEYLLYLLEQEPTTTFFKMYEDRLIELFNQKEKDEVITKVVYQLANELWVGKLTTEEFKKKIDDIYLSADENFEEKS